jgi:hypothetical protein
VENYRSHQLFLPCVFHLVRYCFFSLKMTVRQYHGSYI